MSSTLLAPPETATAAADRAPAVRLAGAGRTFTGRGTQRTVLRGVDLDLRDGEIVAIVGPSGCGKSTLLRLIGGLDAPTAGVVDVAGTTAVAFQEPRLLPWRTLTQNVALGLARGTDTRTGRDRVADLLTLVGLDHAAHQRPREVSGGMAQRASLARALARGPEVLLLDEPFGALDALTRLRMQDLLLDVHAAVPTTVVLVTHDVEEALYLADRVLLLRAVEPGTDGSDTSIARTITVPGLRPRDRSDRTLTDLRAELLEGLGVDTHHTHTQETR